MRVEHGPADGIQHRRAQRLGQHSADHTILVLCIGIKRQHGAALRIIVGILPVWIAQQRDKVLQIPQLRRHRGRTAGERPRDEVTRLSGGQRMHTPDRTAPILIGDRIAWFVDDVALGEPLRHVVKHALRLINACRASHLRQRQHRLIVAARNRQTLVGRDAVHRPLLLKHLMFKHRTLQTGELQPVRCGICVRRLREWFDWTQRRVEADTAPVHRIGNTANTTDLILVDD